MPKNKRSFFERLTGSVNVDSKDEQEKEEILIKNNRSQEDELFENNEEGQLTVDVYQTPDDIIIQAIVAGVKMDDLDVSITQDMLTIRGERADRRDIIKEDYYYQELYWGIFSRSILLPQEIDPDETEATLKNGVLTIKLPKLDKGRVQKIKIKGE